MMNIAEEVYYSLLGQTVDEYKLTWVENAFASGGECERNYEAVFAAYERLCARLGVVNEDADVERIIDAMLDIQKELCLKMFAYGVLYEQNKPRL